METEHIHCDAPDYSYLIGKRPAQDGPPLRLESCPCGLLVLHAPCADCRPLGSVYQSAGAPPPTESRGNRPLVAACLLAFFTVVYLGDAISTSAPRAPIGAEALD